jgi:fatty-acyl-CoA synthase
MRNGNPSYLCGSTEQPLLHRTVDGVLRAAVATAAQRTALIARHQGIRLSYGELDAAVESVAAGFVRHGLRPGERLGIWSPNNAEWVITMFAATGPVTSSKSACRGLATKRMPRPSRL